MAAREAKSHHLISMQFIYMHMYERGRLCNKLLQRSKKKKKRIGTSMPIISNIRPSQFLSEEQCSSIRSATHSRASAIDTPSSFTKSVIS